MCGASKGDQRKATGYRHRINHVSLVYMSRLSATFVGMLTIPSERKTEKDDAPVEIGPSFLVRSFLWLCSTTANICLSLGGSMVDYAHVTRTMLGSFSTNSGLPHKFFKVIAHKRQWFATDGLSRMKKPSTRITVVNTNVSRRVVLGSSSYLCIIDYLDPNCSNENCWNLGKGKRNKRQTTLVHHVETASLITGAAAATTTTTTNK